MVLGVGLFFIGVQGGSHGNMACTVNKACCKVVSAQTCEFMWALYLRYENRPCGASHFPEAIAMQSWIRDANHEVYRQIELSNGCIRMQLI